MQLRIAERLRPFSHLVGTICMIPFSHWQVQAFPTLLKFTNLKTGEEKEESLPWQGPVDDFTLELDLEKGVVGVWGKTAKGYRRHFIEMKTVNLPMPKERLSLGMHKKLDWELVKRRCDLKEILPIWHRLGQMAPQEGSMTFLHPFTKLDVTDHFVNLFRLHFSGLFVPRLTDTDHQGLKPVVRIEKSPLSILSGGAREIRQLFFKEWDFLPCLPPEFHAGRMVNVTTQTHDRVDFEWSKKMLRRVVITPAVSQEIVLSFQKPLKSFRLRNSLKDRGVRQKVDQSIILTQGKPVFLDRFEK